MVGELEKDREYTTELEEELRGARDEVERLRCEVAELASSLNDRQLSRATRAVNRYRHVRRVAEDVLLRIRALVQKADDASARASAASIGWDHPSADAYDVVFMAGLDWQWRWQRPQHLAVQWAAHGHRVFYVVSDFRPCVNPAYLRTRTPYALTVVHGGVCEIHLAGPRELRPRDRRMFFEDRQELVRACQALRDSFDIRRAVCVVQTPFWAPLAFDLREQFGWSVVYDLCDRWSGVHPKAHSMLSAENSLIRGADLVVTTARLLGDEAKLVNPNVVLIPNAADVDHFSSTDPQMPDGLGAIPGSPVVGYFGSLRYWFDAELIRSVAARHPEWTFVLIGTGLADRSRLCELTNVRLLGEVPYRLLPGYLSRFDVCVIPFKLVPVTAATDPVKLYEYLAAGKPVVATALPELYPYRDVVCLANTAAEFEQGIKSALVEDSPDKRRVRREFAQCHSWHNRFLDYDQAIRNVLNADTADRAGGGLGSVTRAASPKSPLLTQIEPSVFRVRAGLGDPVASKGTLQIEGQFLTPECVVVLDEQYLATEFISSTELRCQLPAALGAACGCFMVSIMNKSTWKESNRRVLLVEHA